MTPASRRTAVAGLPPSALAELRQVAHRLDLRGALRGHRHAPLAVAAVAIVVAWAVLAGPAAPAGNGERATGMVASPPAAAAGSVPEDLFLADAPGPAAVLDPIGFAGKTALVVALLYVTLRGLRRLQAGSPTGSAQLVVLESRPLASKASVHLVAVGDRRILVGLTHGSIAPLAELGPQWWDETASSVDTPPATATAAHSAAVTR